MNLSEIDYKKYIDYIKEKYPIYKELKEDSDYLLINNTFGENNYPTWEEIYEIVKNELYKNNILLPFNRNVNYQEIGFS